MRICSLLPSATEILFALGLGDEIVGVSHECGYPPEARAKPCMIRTTIDQGTCSSEAIDQAVRAALACRTSLYVVDEQALRDAQPDLIVAQELCEVCAIDSSEVVAATRALSRPPRVLSLHPHTLREALEGIRLVGEVTGRMDEADQLLASLWARLERVRERVAALPRPRVFCLEWLNPPMASGHWVPEQAAWAGGLEVLGRAGEPSRYVSDEEIAAAQPEVVVLMPCGFSIERTRRELSVVQAQSWWRQVPAVRDGRVYLVDGPAYFNQSGPRLVDGVELLERLLHPDGRAELVPGGCAWARL
jgi:iron complex transport system substrate-binding protein